MGSCSTTPVGDCARGTHQLGGHPSPAVPPLWLCPLPPGTGQKEKAWIRAGLQQHPAVSAGFTTQDTHSAWENTALHIPQFRPPTAQALYILHVAPPVPYHNIVVPSLSTGRHIFQAEDNELPPWVHFSPLFLTALLSAGIPYVIGPHRVSTHVDSKWKCWQPSWAPGMEQGEERGWLCPLVPAVLWGKQGSGHHSQQEPTSSKP